MPAPTRTLVFANGTVFTTFGLPESSGQYYYQFTVADMGNVKLTLNIKQFRYADGGLNNHIEFKGKYHFRDTDAKKSRIAIVVVDTKDLISDTNTNGLSGFRMVIRAYNFGPSRDRCCISKPMSKVFDDISQVPDDVNSFVIEDLITILGGGSPDDPEAETFVRQGVYVSAGTTGGNNTTTGTSGAVKPNSITVRDSLGALIAFDNGNTAAGKLVNARTNAVENTTSVTYTADWSVTVGTALGGTAPYTVEGIVGP